MLPIVYRGRKAPGKLFESLVTQSRETRLVVLPGNERPSNMSYVCIVPVLDHHALFRDGEAYQDRWPYDFIEDGILTDVRNGKAIIILDYCNEGPNFLR